MAWRRIRYLLRPKRFPKPTDTEGLAAYVVTLPSAWRAVPWWDALGRAGDIEWSLGAIMSADFAWTISLIFGVVWLSWIAFRQDPKVYPRSTGFSDKARLIIKNRGEPTCLTVAFKIHGVFDSYKEPLFESPQIDETLVFVEKKPIHLGRRGTAIMIIADASYSPNEDFGSISFFANPGISTETQIINRSWSKSSVPTPYLIDLEIQPSSPAKPVLANFALEINENGFLRLRPATQREVSKRT